MSNLNWDQIVPKLKEALYDHEIKWRVNRVSKYNNKEFAHIIPYVSKTFIQDRLDNVVGPQNWNVEYRPIGEKGITCGISIREPNTDDWVCKWDGAEEASDDNSTKNDNATKTGCTNAFKRAANAWGIARELLDIGEKRVEVQNQGKIYVKGSFKQNGNKIDIQGKCNPPRLNPKQNNQSGNTGYQSGSQYNNQSNKQESNTNQSPQGQQNTNNNQNNQSQGISRDEILQHVQYQLKQLDTVSVNRLNFLLSLFKNANPNTQLKNIEDINVNATWDELKNFYSVLKPVAKVVAVANKLSFSHNEVLSYIKIIKPQENIQSFYDCFNILDEENLEDISNYIVECVNKDSATA